MLITFFRAIVLYLIVLVVMRLMGKREIGQLQPFELAISIMIARCWLQIRPHHVNHNCHILYTWGRIRDPSLMHYARTHNKCNTERKKSFKIFHLHGTSLFHIPSDCCNYPILAHNCTSNRIAEFKSCSYTAALCFVRCSNVLFIFNIFRY